MNKGNKSIEEIEASTNPDSITYVDDNFVLVKNQPKPSLQESLDNAKTKVTEYMVCNKLALNKEKTQLMVNGTVM